MMADEAQRPRCVATSKQIVSKAPRMMPAVTGSTAAGVGSGGRGATRRRFSSKDTAAPSELTDRQQPSRAADAMSTHPKGAEGGYSVRRSRETSAPATSRPTEKI